MNQETRDAMDARDAAEKALAKSEEACGHLMKLAVERLTRAEEVEKAHGDCDSTIKILIEQKVALEADSRELAGILDAYQKCLDAYETGANPASAGAKSRDLLMAALARRAKAGEKGTQP